MLTVEQITMTLIQDRRALTAYFAMITRDHHLAEDIFQDVCVKAVGRPAEFESVRHVINWSRLAGRNRAIDLLRARTGAPVGLSEAMLDTLAAEWPRSDYIDATRNALVQCLEQVTPYNRELLRLRYFERLPGADVAAALGRKLETVYQALARIHKTLGQCVRQRLNEELAGNG